MKEGSLGEKGGFMIQERGKLERVVGAVYLSLKIHENCLSEFVFFIFILPCHLA